MNKVGQRTLALEDPSRRDWSGMRARPLVSEVWYPAIEEARTQEPLFGQPEPLFRTDAVARDAPIEPGGDRLPLVLLSHGTGGTATGMGWLAHRLVSHGYLAAGVNHHGNTALEPYLPQAFMAWWERAIDLSVLLDRLLGDPTFGPRIDASRVGVAGFSLGGCAAITLVGGRGNRHEFVAFCSGPERDAICDGPREFPEAAAIAARLEETDRVYQESLARHNRSHKDPRVRAAFVMNPALGMAFTGEVLAEVDVPVHVVVCEGDSEVPARTNGCRFADLIPGAGLLILEGSPDHYVFLCEATEAGKRLEPSICVDPPGVDRRGIHEHVAETARHFFDRHLSDR